MYIKREKNIYIDILHKIYKYRFHHQKEHAQEGNRIWQYFDIDEGSILHLKATAIFRLFHCQCIPHINFELN